MTESFVHVAMREYLKKEGWTLVAGEYPGGSDDELYVLSIMDPSVACDNSPDPRRHSEGEIFLCVICAIHSCKIMRQQ